MKSGNKFLYRFIRKVVTLVFSIIILSYVALVILIATMQNSLLYRPIKASLNHLKADASRLNMHLWHNEYDEPIGWHTKNISQEHQPVLIFHGNGGHALHRSMLLHAITKVAEAASRKVDVYVLEYPGYGFRPGKPSEKDFIKTASEAFKVLIKFYKIKPILVGESLGTATASHVARLHHDQIYGLLLITPFNNLLDAAKYHYPFIPLKWVLRENYDSEVNLKNFTKPLCIVAAELDTITPAELGRKLYHKANQPKKFILLAETHHNTVSYSPDAEWLAEAWHFLIHPSSASVPLSR